MADSRDKAAPPAPAGGTGPRGATEPVWRDAQPDLRTTPLTADAEADVCVVGAGIAGMTTAYLLAREGQRVVVLDDGPVGGGETGRTTAQFVTAVDDRYYDLERLHGEAGARLVADSHSRAIDRVEEIVRSERIECGFERVDGYLFVPPGESAEPLDREHDAARRAGLSVRKAARAPLDGFETGPALVFPGQAQLHPLRYLAGLLRAVQAKGGRVHTDTHVARVEEAHPARVQTEKGPVVSAAAVVLATNTPVLNRVAIHTKQAPYRSYVIALQVPKGRIPHALWWDTSEERGEPDPYHYVRILADPQTGAETLISGGEDHKTGQADDAEERFARLERWTRERFPASGPVVRRWSGQVMEPVDSLAFLGRNPGSEEHVYVITGDSGNGMTHTTIGAWLVTDLIRGRANPWTTLYDPKRVSLRAVGSFVRENANVVARYGEWATGGDAKDEEDVAPGTGAVVRRGLKKVAVYRDEAGALHRLSAVCPHLGCVVHWNRTEQSWDCPCHGSRFDRMGKVLNGPANVDLERA
jgi:glycine/D-amino acid oxidase-like deaminating enzyme/nitrite reductase/ring-hydroxylating ferredoxin subunit